MKVLHITQSDGTGGAAIATMRLHRAMLNAGIESRVLVASRMHVLDQSVIPCYSTKIGFFMCRYIKPYLSAIQYRDYNVAGDYSYFNRGCDLSRNQIVIDSDIIYIHWINRGYISAEGLERLLQLGKPVVWFMHDMFPITGGCHHSFECYGFKSGCNKCKYFSLKRKKTANRQFEAKIKLKAYNNLYWVAPSKWLYDLSKISAVVDNKRLFRIPNIVSDTFQPIAKNVCRELLKLDNSKKYILFGADNVLKNPYKGFDHFVKMLSCLYNKAGRDFVEILVYGTYYSKEIDDRIPYRVNFLGCFSDELSMNIVYNAADVFVTTSVADNFPLTVMESICCKVPVAAFNVGGIPDMVTMNENGKMANVGDAVSLAENVYELLCSDNSMKKININELCGTTKVLSLHKELIKNLKK